MLKYGNLELIPAPLLGIELKGQFFGADISYSRTRIYRLRGRVLTSDYDTISGIATTQDQITSGFSVDDLPFEVNGAVLCNPIVRSIAFDQSSLVRDIGYDIELEAQESGYPFQCTGIYYGFTGVSGLFYGAKSVTENLEYNTDFKKNTYSHNVSVTYTTGADITDTIQRAQLIASGLINTRVVPFTITGSGFRINSRTESISEYRGFYSYTEQGEYPTGLWDHLYSVSLQEAEDGITTVTQNGSIRGTSPDRYGNAKSGYVEIAPTIFPTCSGVYAYHQPSGTLNSPYLSDGRVDDIQAGTITYNRTFNDESGISTVRHRYTHQLTMDGNLHSVSERGDIQPFGHISQRLAVSNAAWPGIESGIPVRVSGFATSASVYGPWTLLGREKGVDNYNGNINYAYSYSNDPNLGVGSGIYNYDVTREYNLPVHTFATFQVLHLGTIMQSINTANPGAMTAQANIQGFRSTTLPQLLAFANTIVQYVGTGTDVFCNGVSSEFQPQTSTMGVSAAYAYHGFRAQDDIHV